jgi:hypothetical protein
MTPPRELGTSARATTPAPSTSRLHCEHIERLHPGFLAECNLTDADLDAQPLSIEESVAAGWMRPEEARAIHGIATREDLIALGHPLDEVEEMLADQRDRACASST